MTKICNFSYIKNKTLSSAKFFQKGSIKNNFKIENLSSFQIQSDDKIKKNSMKNTIIKKYIEEKGNLLTKFKVKKIYNLNGLWFVDGVKNGNKIKISCKYLFYVVDL